jgi:hypothetical protein
MVGRVSVLWKKPMSRRKADSPCSLCKERRTGPPVFWTFGMRRRCVLPPYREWKNAGGRKWGLEE